MSTPTGREHRTPKTQAQGPSTKQGDATHGERRARRARAAREAPPARPGQRRPTKEGIPRRAASSFGRAGGRRATGGGRRGGPRRADARGGSGTRSPSAGVPEGTERGPTAGRGRHGAASVPPGWRPSIADETVAKVKSAADGAVAKVASVENKSMAEVASTADATMAKVMSTADEATAAVTSMRTRSYPR